MYIFSDDPNNVVVLTVAPPYDLLFEFRNFELAFYGKPGDLDREKKDAYLLQVTATDGGIPSRSNQTTVNITVGDANDNAPVITNNGY